MLVGTYNSKTKRILLMVRKQCKGLPCLDIFVCKVNQIFNIHKSLPLCFQRTSTDIENPVLTGSK